MLRDRPRRCVLPGHEFDQPVHAKTDGSVAAVIERPHPLARIFHCTRAGLDAIAEHLGVQLNQKSRGCH
jgi:hypothetical protein